MEVKTSKEHDTENQTKTAIFGGIGAGKSFLVNSILGRKCVKEERIRRELPKQNEYIKDMWNGSPVLIIETPGLDGQGLAFSKAMSSLESNIIESIDKAVIVIKNKRLKPTESEEILKVLENLNYKDFPGNFCFVINDEEEMQTKPNNGATKIRNCMSLLDITDYEYLGENNSLNTSKVLYIPNKNATSFASQIEKLQAFSFKKSPKQIKIKDSIKVWSMGKRVWGVLLFSLILSVSIAAMHIDFDFKRDNQTSMTEVRKIEIPKSEDTDLQSENAIKRLNVDHERIVNEKDQEIEQLREKLKKDEATSLKIEKLNSENNRNFDEIARLEEKDAATELENKRILDEKVSKILRLEEKDAANILEIETLKSENERLKEKDAARGREVENLKLKNQRILDEKVSEILRLEEKETTKYREIEEFKRKIEKLNSENNRNLDEIARLEEKDAAIELENKRILDEKVSNILRLEEKQATKCCEIEEFKRKIEFHVQDKLKHIEKLKVTVQVFESIEQDFEKELEENPDMNEENYWILDFLGGNSENKKVLEIQRLQEGIEIFKRNWTETIEKLKSETIDMVDEQLFDVEKHMKKNIAKNQEERTETKEEEKSDMNDTSWKGIYKRMLEFIEKNAGIIHEFERIEQNIPTYEKELKELEEKPDMKEEKHWIPVLLWGNSENKRVLKIERLKEDIETLKKERIETIEKLKSENKEMVEIEKIMERNIATNQERNTEIEGNEKVDMINEKETYWEMIYKWNAGMLETGSQMMAFIGV